MEQTPGGLAVNAPISVSLGAGEELQQQCPKRGVLLLGRGSRGDLE